MRKADDIFVYLCDDIPASVGELVSPCPEGYTVLISSRLDDAHRQRAYEHALKHIENGDFDIDNLKTVQEIEALAHGISVPDPRWTEEIARLREKRRKNRLRLAKKERQIKRLMSRGYDFYAEAERKWLEPQ